MRKKPTLRGAADIGIIVLGLAVATQVALQVSDRFRPPAPPRPSPTSAPPQEYEPGDKLPAGSRLDLSKADHTLLLFVRSTCGYGTASMPFYGKLSDARRPSGSISLTAVSSEPEAVVKGYLAHHDVVLDAAISLSAAEFRRYRVRGTPTLVLASRDGTVRKVWSGQLASRAEEEVLGVLAGRLAIPQ